MRICHAIFSSPWHPLSGGGQLAVHETARAMHRLGHDVRCIYSSPAPSGVRHDAPYEVHLTHGLDIGTWNCDMLEQAWVLYQWLRRERFDIVYGHSVNASLFPDVCRRFGVPFVYVFHGRWLPAPLRTIDDPWRRCRMVARHGDYYFVKRALRAAHYVVTFSQWSKRLVASAAGVAEHRIHVRTPGVDPSWFHGGRAPGAGFHVVHWGSLSEWKGVDDLLRAFVLLRARVPHAQLTIMGTGDLEAAHREQARDLGLSGVVRWTGKLAHADIQRICRTAHVAVFPSHVESFGLSVAEARAAAIPVVATAAGALVELVEHGTSGVLVPPRDAEALARALIDVHEHPVEHEQMAKHRGPIIEALGWDRLANDLMTLHRVANGTAA